MSFLTGPKVNARGRITITSTKKTVAIAKPVRQISKWSINAESRNAKFKQIAMPTQKLGKNLDKPLKSALKRPTLAFAADVATIPMIILTDPSGATMVYVEGGGKKVDFVDKIRIAKIGKNNRAVDFGTKIGNYYEIMRSRFMSKGAKSGGDNFVLLCVRIEKGRMVRVEGGRAVKASAAVDLAARKKLGVTLGEVKRGSEVAMVEGFGKMWL